MFPRTVQVGDIVIEQAGNTYSAHWTGADACGCVATGDTEEEALRNIAEALKHHLP